MKAWLDTEFDGFGGPLLSIAVVTDAGRHWYGATDHEATAEWAISNVVPAMGNVERMNTQEMARSLGEFLREIDDGSLEVVADWPEDIKHLAALLSVGSKRFGPDSLVMRLDRYAERGRPEVPHNALSDAEAAMRAAL